MTEKQRKKQVKIIENLEKKMVEALKSSTSKSNQAIKLRCNCN